VAFFYRYGSITAEFVKPFTGGLMAIRFPWRNKPSYDGSRLATLEDARVILGRDNICDAREVQMSRGIKTPHVYSGGMHLTIDNLERSAFQSKKKQAAWELVHVVGLSIEQLYKSPSTRRFFYTQDALWDEERRDWLTSTTPSGYWLINMKPVFTNMSIDQQGRELVAMGAEYVRTPENVFADALFSLFLKKRHYYFERHFHQGPNGRLGHFNDRGLLIFDPILRHIRREDTGVAKCIIPHSGTPLESP
jgi:hypothetical protein